MRFTFLTICLLIATENSVLAAPVKKQQPSTTGGQFLKWCTAGLAVLSACQVPVADARSLPAIIEEHVPSYSIRDTHSGGHRYRSGTGRKLLVVHHYYSHSPVKRPPGTPTLQHKDAIGELEAGFDAEVGENGVSPGKTTCHSAMSARVRVPESDACADRKNGCCDQPMTAYVKDRRLDTSTR